MNSNVGVALIEVLNIHKIVKPLTRVFLGGACLLSTAAHALDINLIEDVAAPLNNDQRNGFIEAAGIWESRISSNVTVNIKVGMVSLSSNVIGQAGSAWYRTSYSDFRTGVTQSATSTTDAAFLATLPTGTTYSRVINQTNDTPGSDPYATWIDTQSMIFINGSNAKALGLLSGTNASLDASIQFNTAFSFDYNRANGITYNQMDFVGVAAHEIGHALGFMSIVDSVDTEGGDAVDFLNMPMDFMRYSASSFALGISDVSAGPEAKFTYINGVSIPMSLGANIGNGQQASHFYLTGNLGMMAPTASYGQKLSVSDNDLLVMDALGWELTAFGLSQIPEPSTYGLFIGALSIAAACVRRKSKLPSREGV